MDDDAARRLQRHIYPRPPEDVLDEAFLRGFRDPDAQEWIRDATLSAESPPQFRCGFHRPDVPGPGPIAFADLDGLDGKTYRVGQCSRRGRIFWGVKGERGPARCTPALPSSF
jgi:hypothetical protein